MKKLLKLISYLKPYRKQAIFSLFLLTCVVFMDLAIPRLVQQIIDKGIAQNNMQVVLSTSLVMLMISFLITLFSIGNNYYSVIAGEGFARDLREALFLKIQDYSYGNIDRQKTGNLIVRMTSDVQMLSQTLRMSLRIGTRAPLLMIGSIVLMVSTNIELTLKVIPLLVVTILVVAGLVLKLGPVFMQIQKKLDQLNTILQENIAGVRVVKAFVRQDHEKIRFNKSNEEFTQSNIRILQMISIFFPLLMMLVNIGILLIIWFGGVQSIKGSLSVGEIVAFMNYLSTSMVPLLLMGMFASVVASGIVSAERVDEVLDDSPEVQDRSGSVKLPDNISGKIEFKNVGFFYNGNCEKKVLDGVNLKIKPGQTVAILGATGSGKTTLVNLIPRFYDVSEGQITIDDIDIRDVQQESLLAHIAVTPQETILFSGTVRKNISFGCPDASQDQIENAAKASQAHGFILELPEKYDTHIAARGVNLSGGQKQRIAIARAILMNPRILILDDSTSSVDVETETLIQNALNSLLKNTAKIIVAQRISTVLNSDKIIVIDKGKVAAQGTHKQLMRDSQIYKEIYDSQLGDGNKFIPVGKKKINPERVPING